MSSDARFDELAAAARRRVRLLGCMVVGLALLAFANAVSNGFAFDDDEQILRNVWLTDVRYLKTIFTSNVWGFRSDQASNYYRPLMHVLYLAVFQVFGARPWAFHLVNVLLHTGSSLLVFLIVRKLLERLDPAGTAAATRSASTAVPALAAGALFAVHPVHTEAVSWVAGLPDVGFTFFALLLIAGHVNTASRPRWLPAASATAFLTALLFKETAVVVLPLLATHDVLLRRPARFRDWVTRYLPLVAALGVYVSLRVAALGSYGPSRPIEPYASMSAPLYAANMLYLFALYLGKLLLPIRLNLLHVFTPLRSLSEGGALLGAGIGLGYALAVGTAWRRSPRVCFALLVTLVPLLPAFFVPAYSQYPFGERYLYLPSIGLAFMTALLTQRLASCWRPVAIPIAMAYSVVLAACLLGTVVRNRVWRDNLTLFTDVVAKSPGDVVANGSLGRALLDAGRYEEAILPFRRALLTSPGSARSRYHLGRALLKGGRAPEAIAELEESRKLSRERNDRPLFRLSLRDLAEAYEAVGRFDAAIASLETLAAASSDPADHNRLGIDYGRTGRYEAAIAQLEIAVRLAPSEPAYRQNLDRARSLARR